MKNIKKHIFASFLFLLWGLGGVFAQEKDRSLPKANGEYGESKFADAEANYRVSNSKFPGRAIASYNLGNAIYKQNQASEAKYAYAKSIKNAKTRPQKHKAFHNMGNVFMKEKNYTEAVEAYKNALRNDPTDEETRYNYALAKKMLKENPPKDDKNKDKKDKDKDKKDQDKKDQDKKDKDKKDEKGDKDKDKKDEKDKDGKNKDDKSKDQEKPKPAPGGISKQRLENLLDAVSNEEKKVQDKVNASKVKGKPTKTEKDW
ncbi:tetratricopeptide repeat protein [Flavobacterium degerlachei]|jgi:tetratricopeptide (TPR) repeat protein|uniref:Tetratricopeptide repeat-containing protein n=1 Tax=Flavobacterium degerlachei TaxID=229203 RepID=A0A1H2RD66_9FLAO|nr:tetratricopeptide repeat protein [Flavobacterium degerlachei]SDW17416.1 Tetratricopeptide repeat-containing protein [Flavobacterium degerlachei]